MKTEQMLNEREKTHGDFERVSKMWVNLRNVVEPDIRICENVEKITAALDMILLKIARIVCGDPNFDDHWDDIAGYAMLGRGQVKAENSTSSKMEHVGDEEELEYDQTCDCSCECNACQSCAYL